MIRVAVFYRVSTKKQLKANEKRKDGKKSIRDIKPEEDLPLQRKACEEFIRLKTKDGWVSSGIEYIEGGVSAFKTHTLRRKVLQQAYEDAKNGLYDVLLIYKLDRLGRRSAESLDMAVKFLKFCHIWVVDKESEFTNTKDADEIMNFIEFWSAKRSSQETKQRVTDAMKQIHNDGIWTGGNPPFGYRCSEQYANKLEVEPREAEIVKLIFNKYVNDGFGYVKIAKWLNDNEYQPRCRESFSGSNFHKIIRNPIYKGYLSYGKTKSTEGEYGSYQVRVEESNWSVSSKKWEEYALIDEDTWEKAQSLRESRKHPNFTNVPFKNNVGKLLFSGFCNCGFCGGPMISKQATSRWTTKDGVSHRSTALTYKCRNREFKGVTICPAERTSIRSHRLEDAVISTIKLFITNLSKEGFISGLKGQIRASRQDASDDYEKLATEMQKLTTFKNKLNDMMLKIELGMGEEVVYSPEQVRENYDIVTKRIKELERKKAELGSIQTKEEIKQEEIDAISFVVNNWSDVFDQSDNVQSKRNMLSKIIDKVIVHHDRAEIKIKLNISEFYEATMGTKLDISATLEPHLNANNRGTYSRSCRHNSAGYL